MSSFHLSQRAKADLRDIGRYTLQTWGELQARHYILQIKECCQRIANNPFQGRLYHASFPDLRRIEQGSHVIFYREHLDGIFVSRILHKSMLPERQPFE